MLLERLHPPQLIELQTHYFGSARRLHPQTPRRWIPVIRYSPEVCLEVIFLCLTIVLLFFSLYICLVPPSARPFVRAVHSSS